ncbi:hypothetical protein FCM41_01400 [Mycoplasma bovis]|nr:hypothetical protein [Mycoplasmopsis bovis]
MKNKFKKILLISSSVSAFTLPIVSASCIHTLSPSILLAKEFLKTNPVSKEHNKKHIDSRIAHLKDLASKQTDSNKKNEYDTRASNIESIKDQLHKEIAETKYLYFANDVKSLTITFRNLTSLVGSKVHNEDLKAILRGYFDGTPYLSTFLAIEDKLVTQNNANAYGSSLSEFNSLVKSYAQTFNYYSDKFISFVEEADKNNKKPSEVIQHVLQFYKDNKIRINKNNYEYRYLLALPPINFLRNYDLSYNEKILDPVPLFKREIEPDSEKWKEFIANTSEFLEKNSNLLSGITKKDFRQENENDKKRFEKYYDTMKNYGTTSIQIVKLIQDILFINGWRVPTYISARLVKNEKTKKYDFKYFLEVLENPAEPNKKSSYKIYDIIKDFNLDNQDKKVTVSPQDQYLPTQFDKWVDEIKDLDMISNYEEIVEYDKLRPAISTINELKTKIADLKKELETASNEDKKKSLQDQIKEKEAAQNKAEEELRQSKAEQLEVAKKFMEKINLGQKISKLN